MTAIICSKCSGMVRILGTERIGRKEDVLIIQCTICGKRQMLRRSEL